MFTQVSVSGASNQCIDEIERLFSEASQSSKEKTKAIVPPNPKVFIGHGRSLLWRNLKDHLTDQHGIEVIAFETGARAGHTIRDILEEMASSSDIAFLVHTAEDEGSDGTKHARLNVVHETGLFQGKLGFSRGVILLEEGCAAFSNIDGIQQIRFSPCQIRETYGDVLATIRREFPGSNLR